jgi:hypothetical protein
MDGMDRIRTHVIPAEAGVQEENVFVWTPACAGVTPASFAIS